MHNIWNVSKVYIARTILLDIFTLQEARTARPSLLSFIHHSGPVIGSSICKLLLAVVFRDFKLKKSYIEKIDEQALNITEYTKLTTSESVYCSLEFSGIKTTSLFFSLYQGYEHYSPLLHNPNTAKINLQIQIE